LIVNIWSRAVTKLFCPVHIIVIIIIIIIIITSTTKEVPPVVYGMLTVGRGSLAAVSKQLSLLYFETYWCDIAGGACMEDDEELEHVQE